jgi:hypothetical protein
MWRRGDWYTATDISEGLVVLNLGAVFNGGGFWYYNHNGLVGG